MATVVPQWKERLPVALGRQSTFCTNFRPRVKGNGEELPCAREHLLQVGGGRGSGSDPLDMDHCLHQREQRGAAVRRRAPAPGMRGSALLGSAGSIYGSRYGSWFASGGPARNSLEQGSTCSRWEGVNLDLDPSLDLVSRGAARNCFVRESTCSKWERGGSGSGYRSESGYSGRGSD